MYKEKKYPHKPKNKRFQELDAIRGLAAIFVVLYHYTYQYYISFPNEYKFPFSFEFGHYGVQAFFIVSGFVIFMTLEKTKKSLDFIIYRSIRLFPTYWISVLITFIIVSIFSLPGKETTILEFLANLTMIHTQFKIKGVDGVYWTLLYELKFYFLMLILYHFKHLKKIDIISIIILSLIIVISLLGFDHNTFYKIIYQVLLLPYLGYFISGIMFYKIYTKKENYMTYIALTLALIVSIVIDPNKEIYIILFIYMLFLLLAFHKLTFITIKPLVFLGTISYALYLIHQYIGYIILNYAQTYHISLLIATPIAIIISMILAIIITFIFEKNIILYLKNYYQQYQDRKNNA